MCVYPLSVSPETVHLCEVSLVRLTGELSDMLKSGALSPMAYGLIRQAQKALCQATVVMEERFQIAAECIAEEMLLAGRAEPEEAEEVCLW